MHLSAERESQRNEYARRHGQALDAALDSVLADASEWERLEHEATLESLRAGIEDLNAERTQPADQVFHELCGRYGLPR